MYALVYCSMSIRREVCELARFFEILDQKLFRILSKVLENFVLALLCTQRPQNLYDSKLDETRIEIKSLDAKNLWGNCDKQTDTDLMVRRDAFCLKK